MWIDRTWAAFERRQCNGGFTLRLQRSGELFETDSVVQAQQLAVMDLLADVAQTDSDRPGGQRFRRVEQVFRCPPIDNRVCA